MKQLHQTIDSGLAIDNVLWQALTPSEQRNLPAHSHIFLFTPNEILFKEGDEIEYVYIVLDGKMKLTRNGVGQPQLLAILAPYDVIGQRAIIAGETSTLNASAMDNLRVLAIDRNFFTDIIRSNMEICHICMQNLAKSVSYYTIKSVNLSQKHVRSRLAESLVSLVDKHGYETDGITIHIYLSREELANMSNMNAANAIRTLSSFVKERILIVDGRKIKVLDENELRRISTCGE